jgi:hypothetical protein
MESIEKAKIRIDHWIEHNKDHLQEYEALAEALESVGKYESARSLREVTALTARSNEFMNCALKTL